MIKQKLLIYKLKKQNKMTTNWNEDSLAVLKLYGDKKQLDKAAKIIGCTKNAARIKYGRTFKDSKKGKHDSSIKPILTNIVPKDLKVNPFVIKQEPFTGFRTPPNLVLLLIDQMLKIKANKLDCVMIPLSVADSQRSASNIFQRAKNYLLKDKEEYSFSIKSTFSDDGKKTYLGAKIWRLK